MKKWSIALGAISAGVVGLGIYTLMNKNTKAKADKLINNVLDKANKMTNDMMEK